MKTRVGMGWTRSLGISVPTAIVALAVLVSAGVPLVAGLTLPFDGAEGTPEALSPGGTLFEINRRTIVWAISVGVVSALVGWAPGRQLGRALARGHVWPAWLVFMPVAIPAYAVFHAWWQAWSPGTSLFERLVAADLVPEARAATLFLAFVSWSWPLAALAVAPFAARADARVAGAMRLDRVPRHRRLFAAVRREWLGVVTGGLLASIMTAANTIAFDLAQVYVIGNELRAMDGLGRPAGAIATAAIPICLLVVAGGVTVWWLARPRPAVIGHVPAAPGRVSAAALVAAFIVGLGVPAVLLVRALATGPSAAVFIDVYGVTATRSVLLALAIGAASGIVAYAATISMTLGGARARRIVGGAATISVIAFVVPGFAFVASMEHAWNRGWPFGDASSAASPASLVYRTTAVLLLAGLARSAAPALLLARHAAGRRSRTESELLRLDRPRSIPAAVRATGPAAWIAATGTAAVASVLALSDVTVLPRLAPPGFDPLAARLLNAMHYQKGDVVLLALGAVVGVAILVGLVLTVLFRGPRSPRIVLAVTAAAAVAVTSGCGPAGDPGGAAVPLPAVAVHGGPGILAGRFSYPRAIAADRDRERVYVVDKTARVQIFDKTGARIGGWRMPEWDNGKPTGLAVGPDGTVWVADTHYHRVIAFTPDGEEKLRFGSVGEDPGEFIYPTDVAFGPEGRLYVSEYGGNDRIQIFEPDGTFVTEIGEFGPGEGQWNRPQSMIFSPDRSRLYVADACNHRIVVIDPDGRTLDVIGSPGGGAGEVLYPYDLDWLDDGTLIVAEFGNNRVQVIDVDGTPRGRFGVIGAGEGMLKYPWGAVRVGDRVFVLDSGNNRLVEVPRRRLM